VRKKDGDIRIRKTQSGHMDPWLIPRILGGTLVNLTKMQLMMGGALARGAGPKNAFVKAASLKAAAIPELALKDIELTSVQGTKLHAVIDDGAKRTDGKRPIVFVHGFPEGWWTWVPQLRHFINAGHPVLAVSNRGYGASDKPVEIASYHLYDCLAKDIGVAVTYMLSTGEGMKPLLVAHDFGAIAGWAYLSEDVGSAQWDVAGYVSLAVPPKELQEATAWHLLPLWARCYMFVLNLPSVMLDNSMLLLNAYGIGVLVNDTSTTRHGARELNLYRTDKLQPGAMTAQINWYRALIRLDPKKKAENVLSEAKPLSLPVLMVRGVDDYFLIKQTFEGWEKILANAELIELDHCSHWIPTDQPDATNAAISKLLAKLC